MTYGATGHVRPMVGLAQAIHRRGLETIVVSDRDAEGSPDLAELPTRILPDVAGAGVVDAATQVRAVMSVPAAERPAIALRHFLARSEAWVPALSDLVDELRPDVILRESRSGAAWLAAERAGLPAVTFNFHVPPRRRAARCVHRWRVQRGLDRCGLGGRAGPGDAGRGVG